MRRYQLFEFEDLPWFSKTIREAMTDYLQFVANKLDIYKSIIPVLQHGLKESNTQRIIDIGSGSGGGIISIYRHLEKEEEDLEIILTDLYPNISAFKKITEHTNGQISYVDTPVDATNIPAHLTGLRLQLLSFHHFTPEAAKQILQNAVEANAVIAILEAHERKWGYLISMLFSPLMVLIFTPFIRPFKLSRLLFTYLLPVIPLFVLWDGLVSILRTYTIEEMTNMSRAIDDGKYIWQIGKAPQAELSGILYLLGYPKKQPSHDHHNSQARD